MRAHEGLEGKRMMPKALRLLHIGVIKRIDRVLFYCAFGNVFVLPMGITEGVLHVCHGKLFVTNPLHCISSVWKSAHIQECNKSHQYYW